MRAGCLGAAPVVVLWGQALAANARHGRVPIPGDGDDLVGGLARVTGLLGCHKAVLSWEYTLARTSQASHHDQFLMDGKGTPHMATEKEQFFAAIREIWVNHGRPAGAWNALHDWGLYFDMGYRAPTARAAFDDALQCE